MVKSLFTPVRLFFLAVILRCLIAIGSNNIIVSDELDYVTIASHIVDGEGFSLTPGHPTAYRPPAYPYFLAGLLSISSTLTFIKIVQAVIESASCFLLFIIGKRMFSERAGLIAMFIWALFPTSILMPEKILTETLFTFLFLSVVSLQLSAKSEHWPVRFLTGVITGILIVIKPQTVLLLFVLLIYKATRKEYRWFRGFGYVLAGTLLISAPWCIRNAIVFNDVTLSTNGGVNFWIGNNEEANGSYKIPRHDTLAQISNERLRNTTGYELGLEFIQHHPIRLLVLAVKKTAYLFSSQNYILLPQPSLDERSSYAAIVQRLPWWKVLIVNVPYLFILFLGGTGLIFFYQAYASKGMPLHVIVICWTVIHMIYFGAPRFNYPLLPLFALLSGAVIVSGSLSDIQRGKQRHAAVAMALLFILPTTVEMVLTYMV